METSWFHNRAILAAVITAGFVISMAIIPTASAAPAPGSTTFNSVNPLVSPAGNINPNYGLFTCQVGLSPDTCYDPYQIRAAYHINSLIGAGDDGTGKTILIVDAFDDPFLTGDLSYFDSFYGLPTANLTIIHPGGPTPAFDSGWAQEETLDVEYSHAMAPGAKIVLDEAQSNSDADLQSALQYAVSNHIGDVISMSFGENDTCLGSFTQTWHGTFVQAIQQGQTIFASSGDQGAAQQTCDGNSWTQVTSSPASDPLVTAVGGTELHAAGYCLTALGCDPSSNPAAGAWLGEVAWNEGPPFGDFQDQFASTLSGGGGYSTVWSEPSYQDGTAGLHGNKNGRAEPDVSYNAAVLHGVLVRLFGGWYLFGGTSSGSPQWAAMTADMDQQAGHDYGFINSALYKIGEGSSFNDITSGTNASMQFDVNNNPVTVTGYNAGPGWDAVTGLGTPIANNLATALAKQWSPGQGTAAINGSKHG